MEITSSHPDITDVSSVCAKDRIGFDATTNSPGTSDDYHLVRNSEFKESGGTPTTVCYSRPDESLFTPEGSLGASPDAIIFNNEVSHIRRINEFATNNHISGVSMSHSFCTEEHIGTLALNGYVGTSQETITNNTQ